MHDTCHLYLGALIKSDPISAQADDKEMKSASRRSTTSSFDSQCKSLGGGMRSTRLDPVVGGPPAVHGLTAIIPSRRLLNLSKASANLATGCQCKSRQTGRREACCYGVLDVCGCNQEKASATQVKKIAFAEFLTGSTSCAQKEKQKNNTVPASKQVTSLCTIQC